MTSERGKTVLLIVVASAVSIVVTLSVVAGAAWYVLDRGLLPVAAAPKDAACDGAAEPVLLPAGAGDTELAEAPPMTESPHFMGASSSRWGQGDFDEDKVLAAGPAFLDGRVVADGKPLAGLRVRLALNNAVMSQWAVTGVDGRYAVPVPAGTYTVVGYEIDHEEAQRLLAGLTDGRRSVPFDTPSVTLSSGARGEAVNLEFVKPVVLRGPSGQVKAGAPVVIEWEAYPGADRYRVQIYSRVGGGGGINREPVFPWRKVPEVRGTSLAIAGTGVTLQAGMSYSVLVQAEDAGGEEISSSANGMRSTFSIVE